MVNYYETGDALQVVAETNGVKWNGKVTRYSLKSSGASANVLDKVRFYYGFAVVLTLLQWWNAFGL